LFTYTPYYFYAVRISISFAILSEIFIQIGYFFYELCKKTKVDVFLLNTVYLGGVYARIGSKMTVSWQITVDCRNWS